VALVAYACARMGDRPKTLKTIEELEFQALLKKVGLDVWPR
jgi:hypothetical protein